MSLIYMVDKMTHHNTGYCSSSLR